MGSITVNFEDADPDAEFEVPGRGLFKNGETKEFDDLDGDITVPQSTEDLTLPEREELEEKTVPELREMAKSEGVEGYSQLNKDALIEAILDDDDSEV